MWSIYSIDKAAWPSGKAVDCKSSIPSSNLGAALLMKRYPVRSFDLAGYLLSGVCGDFSASPNRPVHGPLDRSIDGKSVYGPRGSARKSCKGMERDGGALPLWGVGFRRCREGGHVATQIISDREVRPSVIRRIKSLERPFQDLNEFDFA